MDIKKTSVGVTKKIGPKPPKKTIKKIEDELTIKQKMDSLSEKSQDVVKTLCSNYRGNMRVRAEFRCSLHYGIEKFKKEISVTMKEIRKARIVVSWRICDEDIDDDLEMVYFTVSANLNLSVEEMAEISMNSQTVFLG